MRPIPRLTCILLVLAACVGQQGSGPSEPATSKVTHPTATMIAASGSALQCTVQEEGVFPADQERVRRVSVDTGSGFSVFRAPLAVNTDGAPNSYHPMDPLGERLAINNFENGITIKTLDRQNLPRAERLRRFEAWRDAGWVVPPDTYIFWENVIAKRGTVPCIFSSGPYAGYFGSLTRLTNGLSGAAAGECGVKDALDLRSIPAIALRGGNANPLVAQGAGVGDLVLAVNPKTRVAVPAIIGDTGNAKRIGEGSVALNMALLGVTTQPTTYEEAGKLDTGRSAMVIAVLPKTEMYARKRPYTAANIAGRVESWAVDNGYGSVSGLAEAALECSAAL
jgi:hypothetical protein